VHGYIPPTVDGSSNLWKTSLSFLNKYANELLHVLDPFLRDRSGSHTLGTNSCETTAVTYVKSTVDLYSALLERT